MTNLGTALWLLIKLEPGATFSQEQMIQTLQQAHPQFALTRFGLLSDQVNALFLPKTLLLLGAIALALFTVLLSGIGLIGVMQYNLQLRHSEFSIKLALGAQFRHILHESGREYLRLLAGAILLSSLLLGAGWFIVQQQPQLLPGLDGLTLFSLAIYGLALLLVTLCGVIAHYLPLRRLKTSAISIGLRGEHS
jgi:putative ABC transport system permease protein